MAQIFKFSFLLAALLGGVVCSAQAQSSAGPAAPAVAATPSTVMASTEPVPVATPAAPKTRVLVGHVNTASGPLPGAVVHVAGSKEMAVTDADGQFQVTVPGDAPVKATASYAGFADEAVTLGEGAESNVKLATVRTVKVDKKHQLKTYLKTARKQAKRSLKRVSK